jgi:hypothetical protein
MTNTFCCGTMTKPCATRRGGEREGGGRGKGGRDGRTSGEPRAQTKKIRARHAIAGLVCAVLGCGQRHTRIPRTVTTAAYSAFVSRTPMLSIYPARGPPVARRTASIRRVRGMHAARPNAGARYGMTHQVNGLALTGAHARTPHAVGARAPRKGQGHRGGGEARLGEDERKRDEMPAARSEPRCPRAGETVHWNGMLPRKKEGSKEMRGGRCAPVLGKGAVLSLRGARVSPGREHVQRLDSVPEQRARRSSQRRGLLRITFILSIMHDECSSTAV